jgi:hypothetical protein
LLLTLGGATFSHKFHVLPDSDTFILGCDAVVSKKLGFFWPTEQEHIDYRPSCIITLGLVDDIKGSQMVKFDQDIRHPVFCTEEVHIPPGIGETKCPASLLGPQCLLGGLMTTLDNKILLLETAKTLEEQGVELKDQLVQATRSVLQVTLRSSTVSELVVYPGQILGYVSLVPEGVIQGRDDLSTVVNGELELDPEVCYHWLVKKIIWEKQAMEIEILKTPPVGTMRVKLKAGEKRNVSQTENGEMIVVHKNTENEEGLYRAFLDLLQQLKAKKSTSFWLDLREWSHDSMTWPQVHQILLQMFQ